MALVAGASPEVGAQGVTVEAPVPNLVAAKWDLNASLPQFDTLGWDVEGGLPQNTVQSILQTRDGHIWIGTSEGLARFNGAEFTTFGRWNTAHFPYSPITALLEAPDGSLWLGTDGSGAARMKDGEVTRLSTNAGLIGTRVTGLVAGPDGSIWIGTTNGLNRFKDGKLTGYTENDGLTRNSIRSLYRARSGEIWVGTSRGLSVVRGEVVTADTSVDGLSSAVFRVLFEAADGSRWMATNAEVVRQQGTTITRYTSKHGVAPANVEAMLEDRHGNLWAATSNGLLRFEREKFFAHPVVGLSAREPLRALFEDREGNLWVGTNDGLRRLRRTAFTAYGADEGLSHNMVAAVCQDRAGALWVGTMGGGLNRLTGSTQMVYLKKHGLLSDGIRALAPARDGGVWVGFDRSGLVHIVDGTVTRHTNEGVFGGATMQALWQDSVGTLWIGTRNGLFVLEGGEIGKARKEVGLDGHIVRALAEAPDGAMWIGTNRGLVRRKEGVVSVLREQDGLVSDSIRALHFDADGVLWIGTNGGGLNWLKDGKVGTCTVQNGLPADTVLDVVDDQRGHLWLTSRQGIFRVAKRELEELARGARRRIDAVAFGKSDGVRGVEGSAAAKPGVWRGQDGRLWFATMKGLVSVNPATLNLEEAPPPVMISRVRYDGAEIAGRDEPVLPPGKGELEITYAALGFGRPEKIRFRYKLDGVNGEWVEAAGRRAATYSGLAPGRHRFHVQARSGAGPWSTSGAEFAFRLEPHFYQTRWFYALVVAVAAAVVQAAFWLRTRALRRREQELVGLVQDRTAHLEVEINERKRTEAALERSEALYHSLVEVLPLSIYRRDRDGRFTFANQHCCQRLGRALVDVLHRTAHDVYPEEIATRDHAQDRQVLETQTALQTEEMESGADGQPRWFDCLKVPVFEGDEVVGTQGLSWDITPRKRAEQQVAQAHRELLDVSRLAGMAEVATGVLHNVGNVLNSVNVSACLVMDQVRASKTGNLGKIATLLKENAVDLGRYLTQDPKGQAIPGYLAHMAEHLAGEQASMVTELERLRDNIDHIKGIVAMQQSYARISGVTETLPVTDVVEHALQMNDAALVRHRIELERDYAARPLITTEKHKVMQILVNLIENAKQACSEVERSDGRITVRVQEREGVAAVSVRDNGVGIAAENLTRIFAPGFTTRKRGHGFGLHGSALTAKELGGRLTVHSEGVGRGAEFVLELPVARLDAAASVAQL